MPRRWPLLLTLLACGVWVRAALTTGPPLDYALDARPAVDALARLDLGAFLQTRALMGPVTLLLRAPFAALAGGDELLAYRLGCLPMLVAVAALLFVLLRRVQAAGHPVAAGAAIAGLFALNPLVSPSLVWGHPEELFCGALCALAVLSAAGGRTWRTAALLGLALGSKQWAVLAIAPVLLAAPAGRGRILLGGGGLAAALTAPMVLGSLSAFAATTRAVASVNSWVAAPNVWWPLHTTTHHQAFDGVAQRTLSSYALPAWVNPIPHPLIVLGGLALGVALWRVAPRPSLERALGLLALVLLLRCALDPLDNVYYHAPFLLALLSRDAIATPRRPLAATIAAALLWLTFMRLWPALPGSPDVVFAAYLTWVGAFALWLAVSVFAPQRLAVGARSAPTLVAAR